jgi:ribosome maturation factor RimP
MAGSGKKKKRMTGSTPKKGRYPSEREAAMVEAVKNIAEPLCKTEGIELVCVEYQRETSGRILRLYIDKPDGVTLDDCVLVSRQLGDLLDVYLENIGPYHLEVSSPGPNRPIGNTEDYDKYKGCEARIKTFQPLDGQRNFRGVLMGLSEENVNLLVDDKAVAIPLQEIQRARLIKFYGE